MLMSIRPSNDKSLNISPSGDVIPANMKILRHLIPVAILSATFALSASAAPTTDYPAAIALAAKENKPVLLEFTGSDWCPPCKMMKKEVLSDAKFQSFAGDKLVFVELDFPQGKKQSPELAKQNDELQSKFQVEGYPTFILLDSKGKELGRTIGFMQGGPEAFIGWIEKQMAKS